MRPILDRLDVAVRYVAAGGMSKEDIPPVRYTLWDLWTDFWTNPGGVAKVGGSSHVEDYPTNVHPRGKFPTSQPPPKGKIALIGHSAGGWIARIYCTQSMYGGRSYRGSDLVHTVVTLGTPHLQVGSNAQKKGGCLFWLGVCFC